MSDLAIFDKFLVNPTEGYQKSLYGEMTGLNYAMSGDPWFTWADVPLMVQHPAVRIGLRLARTPYSQYHLLEGDEVAAAKKEGRNVGMPVNTGNPKADAFVRECFKMLFEEFLPRGMDSYHCWGRMAAGLEWKYDRRHSILRLKNIRYIEPFDTDPQIYAEGRRVGEFAGFRLVRTGGRQYGAECNHLIGTRHAFYFAGHERLGPGADIPRIAGATTPWKESTFPGGQRASRRLWGFTRATGVTIVRYPEGGKANSPIDGQPITPQNAARLMAERLQNGSVIVASNAKHATMDKYAYEIEQREAPGGGGEGEVLLKYGTQLDKEIWLGMEIFEEIFQSSEGGGSWSGKSIPMESWYSQHDETANMVWRTFRKQHLDRVLKLNFGVRNYTADLSSLLDEFRQQGKSAQQGGQDGKPPAPPAAAPGGPEPDAGPQDGQVGIGDGNDNDPSGGGNPSAMLGGFGAGSADRRHHSAIALAMIEAKLRELAGQENPDVVHDLIHWLPHLAHADEAEAFRGRNAVNLSWTAYGTSRGGKKRWKDSATGQLRYQESEPGTWAAKREAMRGTARAGHEITKRIWRGEHTPEDLAALEPHLHAMTIADLRAARRRLQAGFGNATKRDDMVKALTAHVRQRMEDAKAPAEPEAEPTPRPLTGAAALAVKAAQDRKAGLTAGHAKRDDGTPVAPHVSDVHTVNPSSLHVDPERFQYKVKGIKAGGITDDLKGAKDWNPELGGVLLVWRDPEDGKDYVVNGHHRHDLAKRKGTDKVNVRYIDAPNAKQARAKGALANIAEGSGTATDAAKYLRDSKQSVEHLQNSGISMSARLVADADAMKGLSDKSFQKVAEGKIPEATAAIVGKYVHTPELQDKLFSMIERREEDGKQWGPKELETAAKMIQAAGTVTKKDEGGLFGDFEDEESIFPQQVELNTFIGSKLNQAHGDYVSVSNANRAERVKGAGNVLALEENRKQRDKLAGHVEDFDRESKQVGDVAEIVKAGAAKLALAKTKKEKDAVKDDTLKAVQQHYESRGTAGGRSEPLGADAGGSGGSGTGAPGTPPIEGGGTGAGGEPAGGLGDVKPAYTYSEPTPFGGAQKITAHDPSGAEIGSLTYIKEPDGRIQVQDVGVASDHRRRGVASAMYDKMLAGNPGAELRGSLKKPDGEAFRAAYDARRGKTAAAGTPPEQAEPAAEPGTDLFGNPVRKTFGKAGGVQANLEDLEKTVKMDKAKEFAAEHGGTIEGYRGIGGTFKMNGQFYHVGPEADGHPVYKSNEHGEPLGGTSPAMTKEEAKAVMKSIPTPEKLIENHGAYFNTDKATATVPLASIRPSRARPEGIDNAGRFMEGARLGKLPRRDPIKVVKNDDGTYSVADGNSTFANAAKSGWKSIPVQEVSKEWAAGEHARTVQSEYKKLRDKVTAAVGDNSHLPKPKDFQTPYKSWEDVKTQAVEAKPVFDSILNHGGGIQAALGARKSEAKTDDEYLAELRQPGPIIRLANIKGEERAREKVAGDFGGNWGMLKDAVRGSVAVDSAAEIPKAIESLKAELAKHGWELAQQPKNKFQTPTLEGYGDVNYIVKTPTGFGAEVQIHLKKMLIAKEEAHKLYEGSRTIAGKVRLAGGKATPEQAAEFGDLVRRQRKMYGSAWLNALGLPSETDADRKPLEDAWAQAHGENWHKEAGEAGMVEKPGGLFVPARHDD